MKMRRKDRAISIEETKSILEKCKYGTLALMTPENTPYQVPVNYYYSDADNAVYIHCAKKGRKIDCVKHNNNVHFCVVGDSHLLEGQFSTAYESVMIEGTASILTDENEISRVLLELCKSLFPITRTDSAVLENTKQYIDKYLSYTAIVKIDCTDISGKANKGM